MPERFGRDGILVGVDGSEHSHSAVRWAVREALMRSVPLDLIHIVTTPLRGWGGLGLVTTPLPEDFGVIQEERGRQVIDQAMRVVDASAGSGKLTVHTRVFFCPPVPTLIELSGLARMVVVGSRGYGALRRGLLGSVSTALVHHAHCPVAVIHDDTILPNTLSHAPVLVGIDGSPGSELATAIAFEEASWRGVELVALHAFTDADRLDYIPGAPWPDAQSVAEETLAERLAGWQERYPDVIVHRVVVAEHPARHLLDHSESAQLLVVGSHGRGGFAGMQLGSVANAMVHAAHIPVIVARPRTPIAE
ncbi:universal stress protein [Mycobacterium branderi]|uniref:Universal stress protein n=1 Tax=Mycobacterium branderi TaxID=43348 RepID=A0A7I7W771_9MYCO|nr:universal stress protein [Mycobacterium branderi]MCV7231301.1 universal stress protein [Mycobacterium branderi]ORA31671.1 universal stress protein [Mycobacterium branderi]BBZ12722.1 universal stress protein [Mycobacterium branderi]